MVEQSSTKRFVVFNKHEPCGRGGVGDGSRGSRSLTVVVSPVFSEKIKTERHVAHDDRFLWGGAHLRAGVSTELQKCVGGGGAGGRVGDVLDSKFQVRC